MVSYQQDPFLKNKQRKLFASRIWPPEFDEKIDMTRISIEALRSWIEKRITELLGSEDEIVYEYCVAQLEAYDPVEKTIEPREVQINLEGFLGEQGSAIFLRELWNLMLSAQKDSSGIPAEIREEQEKKLREAEEQARNLKQEMERKREQDRVRPDKRTSPDRRRRDDRRRSRSRSRDAGMPRVERRKRTPSPSPKPEVKKEEITVRRKRTPSPSPAKEERPTRDEKRRRSPSPRTRDDRRRRSPSRRRRRSRSPSPRRGDRRRR